MRVLDMNRSYLTSDACGIMVVEEWTFSALNNASDTSSTSQAAALV